MKYMAEACPIHVRCRPPTRAALPAKESGGGTGQLASKVLWLDTMRQDASPSTGAVITLVDMAWCRPASGPLGQSSVLSDTASTAVEGYLVDNEGKKVDLTMAYVGTRKLFEAAGFAKAADTDAVSGGFPRIVMRLDLG
jgi:hypothetical protein